MPLIISVGEAPALSWDLAPSWSEVGAGIASVSVIGPSAISGSSFADSVYSSLCNLIPPAMQVENVIHGLNNRQNQWSLA